MATLRVNRKATLRSGANIGANTTNRTAFSACGIETLSGSARVWKEIQLSAKEWHGAATASTHALSGSLYIPIDAGASGGDFNIPTWAASSTTCDALLDTVVWAPLDADTTASMILFMDHFVGATLTTASGTGWRVNWNYINGAGTCSVKSGSAEQAFRTATASAKGNHLSASLTTQLPPFDQAGQILCLHARMLTGACGAGTGIEFAGARLRYLANAKGLTSAG